MVLSVLFDNRQRLERQIQGSSSVHNCSGLSSWLLYRKEKFDLNLTIEGTPLQSLCRVARYIYIVDQYYLLKQFNRHAPIYFIAPKKRGKEGKSDIKRINRP